MLIPVPDMVIEGETGEMILNKYPRFSDADRVVLHRNSAITYSDVTVRSSGPPNFSTTWCRVVSPARIKRNPSAVMGSLKSTRLTAHPRVPR